MEEQYITNTVGAKYYYKDKAKTILHRLDGPAVEWANGDKEWYVNGRRHRLDGPAYEYADEDKDKEWYVNGVPHRMDGPAIEWAKGDKAWYVNGRRHRLDGPAYEYADEDKEWYVNGVYIMTVDKEGKVVKRMV